MERPRRIRWLWILAALAAFAAVAFAACNGDDDDGGDGGVSGDRIEGGSIVVQGNEFDSLDPHFSAFAQDISLQRMIWRGLYTMDIDNVPQPSMAAALPDITEDGTVYTITLREGLQWSDGDDLLAEDFVAGILRTCNPDNAGQYFYVLENLGGCFDHYTNEDGFDGDLENLVGVKTIDDTTLEITLATAQPTFTIILSLWMTFPSPVHLLPNSSDPWPTDPDELVYNGPYMLTSYTPAAEVTLAPNPNWAAPNGISPTLDSITIKFIDDNAVANNAYRTGELVFSQVDTTVLTTVVSEFVEGEEYFKFLQPSTRGLEMQLDDPTLADLDVRLALSQAIDREEHNRVAADGANAPSTSWIPAVTSGAAPDAFDDIVGFDPESAAQHLADAGYPNGEGFPDMSILVGDSPSARATAEFLQQSFKTHLNIDVDIEVVDAKTRSSRFSNKQFQLFPGGWIQDYPDPENWVLGLFDTGGSINMYNCSDPDIDDLVEKARFNTNDAERISQYQEINELIVTRVCGIAVYWHENNHYLISPNVVGMRENIAGQDAYQAGDWMAEAWGLSE
ncbi:MAG: peptide ABC transporter substrate-binding protein [Chloroflexi bacterium]|nr:peptide ABC transporter substrate-binding protein [Chloroflexota bacterium]